MRDLVIAFCVGIVLGVGFAAWAQVYPVRLDQGTVGVEAGGTGGIIVADAIILRPVTQAPFPCDASTAGAVIYNGESGTSTDQRVCFCTDDGSWRNIQLSDCGFAP